MRNNSKIYLGTFKLLLILSIFLFSLSCTNKQKEDTQVDSRSSRRKKFNEGSFVFTVSAVTVSPSNIEEIITIGGDIRAVNAASITPDTNGTLVEVRVSEGDSVRKGDIIAYVDPSKAGRNFLRNPVKATISGIVSSVPIKIGNEVSSQQVIANIADNKDIEMRLSIPEKYTVKINERTRGTLSLIAFPDERFPMTMKSISSVLSTITHTMPLTMKFDYLDSRIKSGMYGSLDLILDIRQDVLVVRRDAIVIRLEENANVLGVFVVKDLDDAEGDVKIVKFVKIEVGIETNNRIEIISGLKKGDIVITQGQSSLSDGSLVRIFNLDNKELISIEDEIKRLRNQPQGDVSGDNPDRK